MLWPLLGSFEIAATLYFFNITFLTIRVKVLNFVAILQWVTDSVVMKDWHFNYFFIIMVFGFMSWNLLQICSPFQSSKDVIKCKKDINELVTETPPINWCLCKLSCLAIIRKNSLLNRLDIVVWYMYYMLHGDIKISRCMITVVDVSTKLRSNLLFIVLRTWENYESLPFVQDFIRDKK